MRTKTLSCLIPLFLLAALSGQKPSSRPSSRPRPQPRSRSHSLPKQKQVKGVQQEVSQGKAKLPQAGTKEKAGGKAKTKAKAKTKTAKTKTAKTKTKAKANKVEVQLEGKLVDPGKKKVPIPEGASEGDIRAIRGANAMLEAEKKLPKILKKMKIKGGIPFLPFDKIDAWPYEDGFKGMPKDLKKWDQKRVVMAGFMFPIDEVEDIHEFFLVKSLWSCCYGTPPDVNGLVKVIVKGKKGIPYYYDPILLVGTFRLKKVLDEDFCVAIYELEAEVVKVLDL